MSETRNEETFEEVWAALEELKRITERLERSLDAVTGKREDSAGPYEG
jgi:hypothetical protein